MLSFLRTLRHDFATFAVNGFGLFQQPQGGLIPEDRNDG